MELEKPLCKGSGLDFAKGAHGRGVELLPFKNLGNPWVALQGGRRPILSSGDSG